MTKIWSQYALDIGQIEGGFVQGMGWLTAEPLVWNDQGSLSTHAPSTYKIPTAGDVPGHFQIDLWPEPNREDNVFGSKAVGEPSLMLAISVYEALRDAVAQARGDGQAVQLAAPATAENVLWALTGCERLSISAQFWRQRLFGCLSYLRAMGALP